MVRAMYVWSALHGVCSVMKALPSWLLANQYGVAFQIFVEI